MLQWTPLARSARMVGSFPAIAPQSLCNMSSIPPDPQPDPTSLGTRGTHQPSRIEKLVGYPTPLLSLRHLIGSELTHFAIHLRRLISSQHPVVKNTRWLQDSPQSTQTHGLTTLMFSKAVNIINPLLPDVDQFGIIPSQRALAEVAEMVHSAHLLHLEVVNEEEEEVEQQALKSDLAFGNKLVILGGDLLLARACRELAQLYNPKVVCLISQAIGGIMTSSFWRLCLHQFSSASTGNQPPSLSSSERQSWTYKMYHNFASLLRNSCLAAAVLAELRTADQIKLAYFGHNLSIANQALQDIKDITPGKKSDDEFIVWLDQLCQDHCHKASQSLAELPDSDSLSLLHELIHSTQASVYSA